MTVAIAGDGVLALEHLHDDRRRGHHLDQLAEERPLAVHAVKGLGLSAAHVHPLLRDDPQTRGFDARVDRAGEVPAGDVGLEDRKGALHGHDGLC